MRGATVQIKCKNCGSPKTVRVADRRRGWGLFCDKSCKAAYQEKRTGQMTQYVARRRSDAYGETFSNAHLYSNEE